MSDDIKLFSTEWMTREYAVWGMDDKDADIQVLWDWTDDYDKAVTEQRHYAGVESDDHHDPFRRYDAVWIMARWATPPEKIHTPHERDEAVVVPLRESQP